MRVDWYESVRQAEWDVLVTDSRVGHAAAHLYVVAFGLEDFGLTIRSTGGATPRLTMDNKSIATEFAVPAGLDSDTQQLVERQLIPLVRSRQSNPVLCTTYGHYSSPVAGNEPWLRPFLLTTEPRVLAGAARRSTESEVWCLPMGLPDPYLWVRAAIRRWREEDSDLFPTDPGWVVDPQWLTWAELEAMELLEEWLSERRRFIQMSDLREEELRSNLARASRQAEEGARRLITASGDDLVSEVVTALRTLGFRVENRDEINPPGDRLEDLWITSPDNLEWIAIAEVRGYTGGAQISDVLRLTGRFSRRFAEVRGRPPSRMWYLVNQFIGRDPARREPVLAPNPIELAEFAGVGGMVMDTADLFKLLKQVISGNVSTGDARAMLMACNGRVHLQ